MGKRTPIYPAHEAMGAKIIEFGGWDMPVQYAGILEEHRGVRTRAGLFDVSHMGEFEISGPESTPFLQRMVTGNVAALSPGRAMYTMMCLPSGGTVDDLLVYRLDADRYMLVVNAANTAKDLAWLQEHRLPGVEIADRTEETALLALQGPEAVAVLRAAKGDGESLKPFRAEVGSVAGVQGLISRTGYTGEDGFELYVPADRGLELWDRLLEIGGPMGLIPAGLGARDTLRLEAALPLYGHELTEEITPLEAGLEAFVKWDAGDFIGRDALLSQLERGVTRRLVGLVMVDRGIPRSGYAVKFGGREIGWVTSGSFGPTVQRNIGLAMVEEEFASPGQALDVVVRGRSLAATVVEKPFYKRARSSAKGAGAPGLGGVQ
ncbi:glycine cleavage system aminomethyltransferase GcvT [Kyrpidia spormannii]|uniref:Aminomethyltransferase n=2 Tax=Kyrpidia spormannii TaxID=2055160 RepID=A0A6F9E3V9_9BACL|nr:glycine cleavage system aminomethyltransferase GcvT [Kyrpidia spormannii]CAB3391084.1 aminomethyltransferase (glycine cleavage system protein T) [Kyrpidia spormannii]CAB3391991.1 aminomethyltransferase (glycine cleavage system protein T) [Kyrpidia spormannii]